VPTLEEAQDWIDGIRRAARGGLNPVAATITGNSELNPRPSPIRQLT